MPGPAYLNRIIEIRRILSTHSFQKKLRSKSPEIRAAPDGQGNFFVKTPGRGIVRQSDKPHGIVFTDNSFLTLYEKWSIGEDTLLRYSYHYQRPEGWFMRYDMEDEERPGHPRHHLQASALGKNVRLPTGEVRCEEILKVIAEQLVR